MLPTPTAAQFATADFTIIAPGFVGCDPAITVENAVAPEPFYFELDVTDFERMYNEHLADDEDDEHAVTLRAAEVITALEDEYGIVI